jgi:hypothetical protein
MTKTDQSSSSRQAPLTTLLFPFVTNANVGPPAFDTGIVVTNASAEPFGSGPPSFGQCVIHYFGYVTGGGPAPPTQTSAVVAPGSQLIFTLSVGGTHGVAATPGFQGYIVVECFFSDAHGFAFMTDYPSAKGISTAYQAQVISNRKIEAKVE